MAEPTPPVPGDLPDYRDSPAWSAAAPRAADWVPQPVLPPATSAPPDAGAREVPAVGVRLPQWHLAAAGVVIALALTGIWVIAATYEPAGRAEALRATSAPTFRPTWRPPTLLARPSATLVPGFPPAPGLPGQTVLPSFPGVPGLPSLPSTPAPTVTPRLLPPPTAAVTPVPTDARSVRVEAWGQPGATIEVSVADSRRTRYVLPARSGPIAFDLALPATVTPTDFVIVRVHVPSVASGTARSEVACRVLVGGVVLRAQQSRGYAMCQLSPYYDVRRR